MSCMRSLTVLILASCAAASLGRLCTPNQWEGYIGSQMGYVYGGKTPGLLQESFYVSYDAKNKRVSNFATTVKDDVESRHHEIVRYDDHKGGMIYIVDLMTQECKKGKLRAAFTDYCLPEAAKHVGDYSLGPEGKSGLKVSAYTYMVYGMVVYTAVSKVDEGIIPVLENYHGSHDKFDILGGVSFKNITPGIKNATVFDVPESCNEVNDLSEHAVLRTRFGLLAI